MSNWLALSLTIFLFADADVPRINSLRPPANPVPSFSSDEEIPLFPNAGASSNNAQSQSQSQSKTAPPAKNTTLQESSKLALIRYVSGEFAKAIKPLPAGKEGFHVSVGKPLQTDLLDRAVASRGPAVNTGDSVQITKLEFRDHIQVGFGGGGYPPMQPTSAQDQGPPGMQPGMGSTIFLEFGKPLPDITPDELKQLLSPFLNFAKERSAAVQWFDTLPPEMKKAIQDRKPMVGMDREELVAAIGKPDHKVRERDSEGNDIEDWIYGQPPSRTVFVRFMGDHVTSIKQFPQ